MAIDIRAHTCKTDTKEVWYMITTIGILLILFQNTKCTLSCNKFAYPILLYIIGVHY